MKTARIQSQVTDLFDDLPFTVSDWPDVQGGPDVIQAFRGGAVDLATNAAIPPIQAEATGLDARIVAVREKEIASYQIATAPETDIETLSDLRGKKIAISPGQAQGVVVLRTLAAEGIGLDEVEFIELPSPQFLTALQAKQVDAAVLSEPAITKYLDQYGADGARGIPTEALDLLSILWAPVEVLEDPAKAAAIKAFIPLWARADVWTWENKDEWARKYYVDSEGVSVEDAQRIIETVAQRPNYPASWDEAVAWTQETIDLLDESGYFEKFDAEKLFDRRFETVASDAVPAEYRTGVEG
ncbi:ABC transporter substrate-binding protein [Rhodococcus triatomae]|uniref:ABC transporter substrate-binding protein n=1 Tax=Rhodococcus triatomae TaxID=300028 RepID=UPI0020C890F2|nr:ABC transporter substrate-binding protein [Rhodococcus triatomae]